VTSLLFFWTTVSLAVFVFLFGWVLFSSACKKALESLEQIESESSPSNSDPNSKDIKNKGSMILVEQAIISLEDDPFLNAGYGSNLTLDGTIECDAALHISRSPFSNNDYQFGSVGAVSGIVFFLSPFDLFPYEVTLRNKKSDFSRSKYLGIFDQDKRWQQRQAGSCTTHVSKKKKA